MLAPFVAPGRLGRALVGLLVLCGMTDLVSLGGGVRQAVMLANIKDGTVYSDAQLAAIDNFTGQASLAQIGCFLITAIAFLVWVRRVYANQRALGAESLAYTPGWAVGCWFVPFVNLIHPHRVVAEVWFHSSRAASESRRDSAPRALVAWWWTFWLLAAIGDRIATHIMNRADRVPEAQVLDAMITGSHAYLVVDVIWLIAAILAAGVVHRINGWQEAA